MDVILPCQWSLSYDCQVELGLETYVLSMVLYCCLTGLGGGCCRMNLKCNPL